MNLHILLLVIVIRILAQSSTSKEDKATMVSPKLIYNSPEKKRLRQQIVNMKKIHAKKLRAFQQKLRRSTDQVTSLKHVLRVLKEKHLLNETQADVTNTLGGSKSAMFKRFIKKQTNQPVPKQYEAALRSFALTLHYYSPRAYEYVRREIGLCLPHVKTISSWYRTVHGNPGISIEGIESIKKRVKNTNYMLFGSLQFDEMSIREHLEYDGTKFNGYIDLGTDIYCEDTTLAREALVFMVTCINSAWKIPIAYYFVKGLASKEKSNLLIECFKALHDTGLKIISVTCDGTPTNFSVLKLLGCDFNNVSSLQTSFPHPVTSDKIVAFLDPCHMLKLVRNTFGDIHNLIDINSQKIQWSHILTLHKLQESEGMHLGNKLRSAHVNYFKQKMKVRLATQIFSKSVADSLLFCKDNLMLKEFELCNGTIQFLLNFNDLFDILNSKSMRQAGLKQAINSENINLIKDKLNECKMYILSLKNNNSELVIESRRKTGFLGFLICIESAFILYEELCEKNKFLKYLPFYKLSQDHVELLFGCLRHHGGGNNNPKVRQFKAAMKKILVHSDIRSSNTGNCIPLEEISILHVSSAGKIQQSQDIINSTNKFSRLYDEFNENFDENNNTLQTFCDHNYVSNIREITEFSHNIIEYIAGYIVKQLQKSLLCENCLAVLIAKAERNNFINRKNRGGLIQPSSDVIKIA